MRRVAAVTAFALTVPLLSCGDGTGPAGGGCGPDVGEVTVTVIRTPQLAFDWSPRCAVALLLVEEDGSDLWVLSTMADEEAPVPSDNRITPPIAYGATVAGATDVYGPAPLVAGRSYELVLWRAVPAGSDVDCLQRFEDACLMAVHAFTR